MKDPYIEELESTARVIVEEIVEHGSVSEAYMASHIKSIADFHNLTFNIVDHELGSKMVEYFNELDIDPYDYE